MMRRALILVIGLWLALGAAASAGEFAYWTVLLDDQPVPAELPPVPAGNEQLLVSARSLCFRMGADYTYDEASGKIVISSAGVKLEFQEGCPVATVNGKSRRLAVAPRRESGAMMIPVPFVPVAFGCKVSWNHNARMVVIATSGAAVSPPTPPTAYAGPPARPAAPIPTRPVAYPSAAAGYPGGSPPEASAPPPGQPTAYVPDPAAPAPPQPPGAPNPGGNGPMLVPAKSLIGSAGMPMLSMGPMPASLPDLTTTVPMPAGGMVPELTPGVPSTEIPGHSVIRAGTMDDLTGANLGAKGATTLLRPDPAVTGLLIERRYDSLSSTYVFRYRVSNLSPVPCQRAMLVRLLIGGDQANGMQIVQDLKLDKLDAGQSVDFEWTGNARAYPFLSSIVVRAEARIMLASGDYDANAGNNVRHARLSY